jgi:site-specific DNA-methyltransferase (adenine-specific)
MPTIEANSIDSIITDPPYGLSFMGKDWDHGVPGVPFWKAALRVAKPGAALLAFGGTRTHHRLMCAIEDAGWEIRDVLMYLYGSGFPKSHDISKAIDKAAGATREVVGKRHVSRDYGRNGKTGDMAISDEAVHGADIPITSPATDDAALWDGWGTALKPAYEPIILAMKPLPGTFAQNALAWGVAGLNVDGCRVGTGGRPKIEWGTKSGFYDVGTSAGSKANGTTTQGRWPANLLLSHAPGCECVGVRKVKGNGGSGSTTGALGQNSGWNSHNNKPQDHPGYASPDGTETIGDWRCVEGCPVRMLDEGSGELHSNSGNLKAYDGAQVNVYGEYAQKSDKGRTDTGGASRFFTRFHYSAKASRSERELGLLGHIPCLKCGELDSTTHVNPDTGKEEKCRRNGHPTVKPLDLMRWICRLTATPTGGVVLDPFLGSGPTGMAAVMEGRDFIGIEIERESFEIAQKRIEAAQAEMIQASFEEALCPTT